MATATRPLQTSGVSSHLPNAIPSIRIGPPYPLGIRNIVPYIPPQIKYMSGPSKPMVYRNRLFNPEDDNESIESANNEDQQVAITQSKKTTERKPETRTDPKKAIRIGPTSKVVVPIITIDSDESPNNIPSYSHIQSPTIKGKAKINTESKSQVVEQKHLNDAQMLASLMPQSSDDEDESLSEMLQHGMTMVDPEELISKLQSVADQDKPKRFNIKGLYSHSKHGNIGKVVAFLNAGTNPIGVVKNEEGKTPLHIAASKGHLEVLLLLLYKTGKSKIDCCDHNNRTPLYMAVDKGHLKVATFLVKAGASIECKSTEGTNLLHVASRRGNLHAVKWLIKLGVPVNQQDNFGWSALMWAAETDTNSKIIRYLIKQGAYTNLLDNEMNVCLHWSAIAGSFECAKELVEGSTDSHINAKNKFGETPLHVSAKGDHFSVTQFLLLNGSNPKIKNHQSCTALDVCPSGSKTFHCLRIQSEVGQSKSKPYMYLTDISLGKEKIPISCVNDVDNEAFPNDFVYVVKPEESKNVAVKRGFATVNPCKCVGTCSNECKCVKLSEKQKLWYSEDGKLDISIFEEDSPVLYECTPLCSCWSYCLNRVAQNGIQYPLQVFKTRTKGWGLRTLTSIPQGSFILSYIGELITHVEAERRGDTFLFNLDLKASGDEPNCIDAWRIGNCGRFINHSCDANMKAVKLFTNHRDVSFPEVAFFAVVDIQAKEELCFNYGDTFWDVKNENEQQYCKCMSDNCRYGRKSERKKDYRKPKRPCLFCGKNQSRYTRHILSKHKDEERVTPLLKLNQKEQQRAIDLFRKEAIRIHNVKCLNDGENNFLRERKSNQQNVPVMCSGCNGFFQKSYKSRHQLVCPANSKNLMLPMIALDKPINNYDNFSEGFKSLLDTMRLDEVGDFVKTDQIILMIGNRFFNSIKRKKDKKAECLKYVRSRMRLTARVYIAFRQVYNNQTEIVLDDYEGNAADMFRRETVTLLGNSINTICDKQDVEDLSTDESITTQMSRLKISILYLLKTNSQYLMGFFLMRNEERKKERVVDFLQVLNLVEDKLFGDAISDINYGENVNQRKSKNLPNNEDVQLLVSECVKVMKTADVLDVFSGSFVSVRAATATYLIIFNTRRGGEPLRLVTSQWEEALKGEWTDQMPDGEDSDLLVTFQTGKGIKHLVPVMFPPETHTAMQYLVNPEVTENANVAKCNKYIFPSIDQSQNHTSGWHCVNDMLLRISRKGCLNATKNRHRVASLLSKLQLTEKEKELIFKHFGQGKTVNEYVYQAAAGTLQVQSTGQMLLQVSGYGTNKGNCGAEDSKLESTKRKAEKDETSSSLKPYPKRAKTKKYDFVGESESKSEAEYKPSESESDSAISDGDDKIQVQNRNVSLVATGARRSNTMKNDFNVAFKKYTMAGSSAYPEIAKNRRTAARDPLMTFKNSFF